MSTARLPTPIFVNNIITGTAAYQFPATNGNPGDVLTTTPSGQLQWVTPGTTASNFTNPVRITSAFSFTPTTITGNHTVTTNDNFLRYTGSGNATLTLPDNVTAAGRQLLIENLSAAVLTIAGAGSDTIDGDALPYTLDTRYATSLLISDGTGNWIIG